MKGLIIKDFYTIRKSYFSTCTWGVMISLYFVMFSFATVFGNFKDFSDDLENFTQFLYVVCLLPFIVGSTAISSFNYDSVNKFNEYELTLPVTDNKKILSKYISSLLCILSSAIHLLIPVICCKLANKEFDERIFYLFICAMELTAVLICFAIPVLYFTKGDKKGMMIIQCFLLIFGITIGIIYGSFPSLGGKIGDFFTSANDNIEITSLVILGITIILFAISYYFAVLAYKKGRGITK